MKKLMVGAMLCIAALSTTFAQERKCCHKKATNSKEEVVKCKDANCEKKCCVMTEMQEKKKCKEGCKKPCCKKTKVKVNRIDMARVAVSGKLTEKKFKEIPPSKIASKRVLSAEEAVKKYGEKGKYGVVEVTLKK